MERIMLSPSLWQISALEPERRVFGVASYTDHGVGYNTYIRKTSDGFVSFGSLPERYTDTWLDVLSEISGGELKYAVFFGTDSDIQAARRLLTRFPDTTVIAGKRTIFELADTAPTRIEIRTGRTLTLGGCEFCFHILTERFPVPSLYVIDKEATALFTADAFGSVCAVAGRSSELMNKSVYWQGVKKYYADILGERRESLANAVKLLEEHHISLILPSVGPAVDEGLKELGEIYTSAPKATKGRSTAIVYAPGNYVPELVKAAESGLRDSGCVDFRILDMSAENREDILPELRAADAYIFATPELDGDAAKSVWDVLTSLSRRDCAGKDAGVLVSTRSVGEAADSIRPRLSQLGLKMNLSELTIRGNPGKAELDRAYDFGFAAGCSIQKIPNTRKPRLVRCPVCGEIFDASLGICPVCGVSVDMCVPADEDESVSKADTNRNYLIIGGGAAAVSAAEAIRLRDGTGSITMLSAERYLPINRPMLTKDLERLKKEPESITMHSADWYSERGIDLHLGVKAERIDIDQKAVIADNGQAYPYDKLIYAAGAECFVPPFSGHDKPGVLTIRHLGDCAALQGAIDSGAKSATVIGGGVLGLEAASELMRAGLKVTVLEATPQIVGRQIDADSANILKAAMEGIGVRCFEGVSIAGITGEEKATGVVLADGREFPADIILVSCGNRANVGPAKDAGLKVERSIVVNERMETSVPDIYACGDCAQLDGLNYQLWQEAVGQGKTAGANAAGESMTYANVPLGLSLEGFGTSLFAMGDPGKRADVPYKTVETRDDVAGRHEKYWFFGGRLEGAVLIGAPEKTADITRAITEKARHSELFKGENI